MLGWEERGSLNLNLSGELRENLEFVEAGELVNKFIELRVDS
jgi:hypothetical protein